MSTVRFDGADPAATTDGGAALAGKLRELQKQLLDLSRRNRLLNFRGDKGAASLRIVDERSPEVFRILAVEGHAMQFLARENAPKEIAAALAATEEDGEGSIGVPLAPLESASAGGGAGAAVAGRHRDRFLQTTLPGEKLQTRLTRLAQQARSSLDEQGANILYLVLGVVAWRDTQSGEVVSNAPLLLVPVELERKNANSATACGSLTMTSSSILACSSWRSVSSTPTSRCRSSTTTSISAPTSPRSATR